MLFNFDEDKKRELSKELKQYVYKNSELEEKELEKLSELTSDIDDKEFEYRIKAIVDFFKRAKDDVWKNRIHNAFKYAQSVINSNSFFENQKWVSAIPDVDETKEYLEQRRKSEIKNPDISDEFFHKKVIKLKKMYHESDSFKLENIDLLNEKQKEKAHKDYALSFETLDDEDLKNKLYTEIVTLYRHFADCELEYKLFKNTLLNIYRFYGKNKYSRFIDELSKRKVLSINELIVIRNDILNV
jgi:hypothetical protein